VNEGKGFEQIEARKVGIAEPACHQRRIDQQHRRIGGSHDRIALGHGVCRPVACSQPMPAMAGVQRGQGDRIEQ
jgi:hypothetical protein